MRKQVTVTFVEQVWGIVDRRVFESQERKKKPEREGRPWGWGEVGWGEVGVGERDRGRERKK